MVRLGEKDDILPKPPANAFIIPDERAETICRLISALGKVRSPV